MKIVYIAHPIGGDIEANLTDLRRIVKKINYDCRDIVPFVPYYADVVSMDDNEPWERRRGMQNGMAILMSGAVKEVWLTGDIISTGMKYEWEVALSLKIPVLNKIGML
jgi:hypothetical protein